MTKPNGVPQTSPQGTPAVLKPRGYGFMRMRILGLLLLGSFLGAGCGDLFEVDNPTNLDVSDLDSDGLLGALANTPEGAFSLAYDDLILSAGGLSDETTNIYRGQGGDYSIERGFMTQSARNDGDYDAMAQARWVIDEMIRKLEKKLTNPNTDLRMARAVYWAGLARVALADHYQEVPIDGGRPEKPDVMLEKSLAFFDRAAQIASAGGDANLRAAALGSKARIYRSLYFERGIEMRKAPDPTYFASARQAAEQALAVKPDFRLDVHYQEPGSANAFYQLYAQLTSNVMDPTMGELKDPVSGQLEPRVKHGPRAFPVPEPLKGWVYAQMKYTSRSDDIPVSRWQEVRLVLAEAHLLAGNLPEAVNQINVVRAAARLPAFQSNNAAAIYTQLKYERKVEFWLEGRRWQDHRYYEIFPHEWVPAAIALGIHRRWPVSVQEEQTNPFYRVGG